MFTQSECPKSVGSETLAWGAIENRAEGLIAAESDQERAEIREEQDNIGTLLAFPWASEQGLLNPVTLTDMPESPHLIIGLGVGTQVGDPQPHAVDAEHRDHPAERTCGRQER
jgi:hypothetical protein